MKRRDIAKRRAKLGFDDGGAEEMDDKEMEHYEYIMESKERTIQASGERQSVKISTQIDGISTKDVYENILREDERYKSV